MAANIQEKNIIHKFGRAVVGTTFTPIAFGGLYRTLQPAAATALRVKAGNANDTAAGSGAREVTLVGINASGDEVTEALATAGASASSNTSASFIRLYRVFVSSSGTYATQTAGSHSGNIVIENAAGSADWATIDSSGFARGQSEIAIYTVPNGYSAYINSIHIGVDSGKAADILMFVRENILRKSAPYSAMRIQLEFAQVTGAENIRPNSPMGPYPPGTDIGFMAKVASSTGEVDIDFELTLKTPSDP